MTENPRPPAVPPAPAHGHADPYHRALRRRGDESSDAIARSRHEGAADTARELVTIIDQGHIPTQPDHVFIGNPTAIDAEDVEGATPTFAPDANQAIPVIVIRKAAVAGDVLVAHAVAGRWVAELGGGCKTNVCVLVCGHAAVGATVQIWSGATMVAECTTNSLGCCQFTQSGTYTVVVLIDGNQVYSGTKTLSCAQINIDLDCCVTVCVFCCDGGTPYPFGVTVSVSNADGPTLASGMTDDTGCVTLSFPSSALTNPISAVISVESDCSLYADYSDTYSPICGQEIDVTMTAADPTMVCCGCTLIPQTLTLTDAAGSITLTYDGFGTWSGCHVIPGVSPTFVLRWNPVTHECEVATPAPTTGPVTVYYAAGCTQPAFSPTGCVGSADQYFWVTRNWGTAASLYTPSAPVGSPGYPCDPPFGCVSVLAQGFSSCCVPLPVTCEAFAGSSLACETFATPYGLPDPLGGGVTIS